MLGSDGLDRRKSSRYSVGEVGKVPIIVDRIDSDSPQAQLVSLSEQGASFYVGTVLRLSEVVRLRLELPRLQVSLESNATIIWSRPSSDGMWLVGCSFDRAIPSDVVDRLAEVGLVDRRLHQRFPVNVPGVARWQPSGETSSVTITDYSVGGFCLECDTSKAVGANVRIQFEAGDTVSGVVRWSSRTEAKFLLGCDFLPTSKTEGGGANSIRKLSDAAQASESRDAVVARQGSTKSSKEWMFAIVCVIACGFSMFEVVRSWNAGSPNATSFSVAYVATSILCLLGSALPFVRSNAEKS